MTKKEAIDTLKLMQAQVEWEYPMDYSVATDMAIAALAEEPTIEERKKGEWERKSFYDSTLICSECGIEGRWDFEYCPYCGADMRGEQDG